MTSEYVSIDGAAEKNPVSVALSVATRAASSVGASAKAAADGTRVALHGLVTSKAPPIQVDWDPLLPRSGLSLTERIVAAQGYIKPWNVFASGKALSFPSSASQIKPRYVQNVTRFFYNYLALALADIAISGVFHRFDAVITFALIVLLYIAFEDNIELLGGRITIGPLIKSIIVSISFLVTLVFGGVIPYLFHSIVVAISLFAAHGILRETEDEGPATAYPEDSVVFDANNPTTAESSPAPTDF